MVKLKDWRDQVQLQTRKSTVNPGVNNLRWSQMDGRTSCS